MTRQWGLARARLPRSTKATVQTAVLQALQAPVVAILAAVLVAWRLRHFILSMLVPMLHVRGLVAASPLALRSLSGGRQQMSDGSTMCTMRGWIGDWMSGLMKTAFISKRHPLSLLRIPVDVSLLVSQLDEQHGT